MADLNSSPPTSNSTEINRSFGHSLPNIGIKLNNSNYLLWKTHFKPFLRAYRMLDLVEGKSLPPSPTLTLDSTSSSSPSPVDLWVERDQLALGWILSTVDDFITTQLIGCETSHDAWKTLEHNYSQLNQARVMQLRDEFTLLKKGSLSMSEYLNRAKILVDKLAAIGRPLSQDEILSRVLQGLGPEYAGFRTALNLSGVAHNLESLHGPLLTQESSLLLDHNATFDTFAASPMANLAHHNNTPRPQQQSSTPHNNYNNFSSATPQYHQQRPPHSNRGNRNIRCQVCNRNGHSAFNCYNRFNKGFHPQSKAPVLPSPQAHAAYMPPIYSPPQAGLLPTPTTAGPHMWYPDSGATHHVTPQLSNLHHQTDYNGPDQVQIGDGSGLTISHTGNSSFISNSNSFHLSNILHVPSISKNLLSVSKFTHDNNCLFEFHPSFCLVKDRQSGTTLLKGYLHNGLYCLPIPSSTNPPTALLTSSSRTPSISTWHHRLGHASLPVVRSALAQESISVSAPDNKFCSSCVMSKCHRLPFNSSSRTSTMPLQLIHTDVWGPSPILSHNGYRYYIHFLDDYSKFSWFYPLSNRSDVYNAFLKFRNHAENILNTKIKFLQTDGALEFLSHRFQTTLTASGIGHRISCPHTPQLNGSAERKHQSESEWS